MARNISGVVADRHGIPLKHSLSLDVGALETAVPATDDLVLVVIDGVLSLSLVSSLPSGGSSPTTIFDILSGNAILGVSQPSLDVADVTLTVDQTQIDHDQLLNFLADEHVGHSGVTLTAGVGLAGGGNITASRTFDIDWTELTEDTNPDEANDLIATYDVSAAAHKKVKIVNIDHDGLTNGAGNKHIDHSAVSISTATGLSGGGDITTTRTISLDVNALSEDTNPDEAADFILTYDTSAGAHKKVKPDNLVLTLSNLTGTLGISHGGTGQTTQTAAMDALSPTSAKGDLLVDNGTNVVALTVGSNGQFLQADSTQADGMLWSTIPGVSDTIVTLGTDRQTTSTSLADVTGLSFAMAANTMYYFRAVLFISASATTEGNLISINATNAPTFVNALYTRYVATPTAPSCTSIVARDGGTVSSGVAATNFNIAFLEGVYSNGGSTDTFQLRFKTETGGAASTTVEAGSYIQYRIIT